MPKIHAVVDARGNPLRFILSGPMVEPFLTRCTGEIFPRAISRAQSAWKGARNRGEYTVRDAYQPGDADRIQYFIIK